MQLRILLIESDAAMLDTLQQALAGRGYEVDVVPDGLIGLAELERNATPPDLILLRVEIPRMSGYTVCNKIKRREKLRSIPLILFSSQATLETFAQHRRLRTRADGYLTVPLDDGELLSLVDDLTRGKALSGSFVEVPAVMPESFASLQYQQSAPMPDAVTTINPIPDAVQASTSPELEAVQEISADDVHLIDDDDPMVLSLDDVEDDVQAARAALGAGDMEALIHEEQALTAQQLRDLWSASLEEAEESSDTESTLVGQKPPTHNAGPTKPPVKGSWKPAYATPPSVSPGGFEESTQPRDIHGELKKMSAHTPAPTPVSTPRPAGFGQSAEAESRPSSPQGDEREALTHDVLEARSLEEEVALRRHTPPPVQDTPSSAELVLGEEGDIADLLNAHFQEMDDSPGSDEIEQLHQQLRLREEELEALRETSERQEQALSALREQVEAGSGTSGDEVAGLSMQLAEAKAQLEAYADEKNDLYEEITRLRKNAGSLDDLEAVSLSNVAQSGEGHSALEEELASLRASLAEALQMQDALVQEREQLSQQKEELSEQKEQLDQELALLRRNTDDASGELEGLRERLAGQDSSLHKAEEARDRLSAELDLLKQELEAEVLQRESGALQLSQIQREYEALQRLYNDRENQIEQQELIAEELRAQVKERDNSGRELRSELAALRAHMEGQLLGDDELLAQMADKEKELQGLREDINQLGESYDALESKYNVTLVERERYKEELETRNKALLHISSEQDEARIASSRMEEQLEKKSEQIVSLEQRITSLEKEIEDLHSDLASVSEERNKYRDEMLDLNNELDAGRAEVRNMQEHDRQIRERLQDAERLRDQFESERDDARSKLERLSSSQESLEMEVVQLRKNSNRLEQEHFELEEKSQRLTQENDEVRARFEEEQEARQKLRERYERLETELQALQQGELVELREQLDEKTKELERLKADLATSTAHFEAEVERLTAALKDETDTRQSLEEAQVSSLHSLGSLQDDLRQQVEQHQQELLSVQEDMEQELVSLEARLRQEAQAREQQLLNEQRILSENAQEQLSAELEERHSAAMRELQERHDAAIKAQQDAHEAETRQLSGDHQTQLAELLREQEQLESQTTEQHRDEMERMQRELQLQHDQLLTKLEADNLRMRRQIRELEYKHRQELLTQTEEWRTDTEQRIEEAKRQLTMQNQALVEGFTQRESELEAQVGSLREEVDGRATRDEEREEELRVLRGRLADIESLRRHERMELERTEREHQERVQQLEEKITQLETSLKKGISETTKLYQKLKRHEMRKENTVRALQDALSLLDDDDEKPRPKSQQEDSDKQPPFATSLDAYARKVDL